MLLAGNIIDNIGNPKTFILGTQIVLSIFWLASGFFLSFSQKHGCQLLVPEVSPMGGVSEILSAAIVLTSILQLYNWFSKRYIQVVLIIYFLMQFLGYLTPVKY